MTLNGFDTADRTILAEVKLAHGAAFEGGYISHMGNPKNFDLGSVQNNARYGIKNITIFETTANRAADGYGAGTADVQLAERNAEALDQPVGTPIFYTVDFDVQSSTANDVIAYFSGIFHNAKRYQVGIYGGYNAVRTIRQHGLADYAFQTYAWSNGQWYPGVELRQVRNDVVWSGHLVDLCEADTSEYGGWFPTSVPSPAPQPPQPAPQPAADWMTRIMDALPTITEGAHDPVAGQWFVRRAQALLRDVAGLGIGPSGVDGIFGPDTAHATREFQVNRQLTVDGIIGPQTWSYLVTGTAR